MPSVVEKEKHLALGTIVKDWWRVSWYTHLENCLTWYAKVKHSRGLDLSSNQGWELAIEKEIVASKRMATFVAQVDIHWMAKHAMRYYCQATMPPAMCKYSIRVSQKDMLT